MIRDVDTASECCSSPAAGSRRGLRGAHARRRAPTTMRSKAWASPTPPAAPQLPATPPPPAPTHLPLVSPRRSKFAVVKVRRTDGSQRAALASWRCCICLAIAHSAALRETSLGICCWGVQWGSCNGVCSQPKLSDDLLCVLCAADSKAIITGPTSGQQIDKGEICWAAPYVYVFVQNQCASPISVTVTVRLCPQACLYSIRLDAGSCHFCTASDVRVFCPAHIDWLPRGYTTSTEPKQ